MKRKRLFPIFLITILATLFSFQPYQAAAKQADLLIPLQKPAPASGDHIPASQAAESVVIDFNNITTQTPALYGSNGWWSDQDTGIWQERHHALGVRIMRIPAMQSLYEPVNDDANPEHIQQERFLFRNPVPVTGTDRTITLKNWLTMLKNQDIEVMLNIPYLAGWNSRNGENGISSTYPPRSIPEYKEYIVALLQFTINEVGYSPRSVILEPINEPDLGCFKDPYVPCFWQNWAEADLLKVLVAARQAAKQVSPEIRVVGVSECCGTAIVDHLVRDHDGLQLLDGFTYHSYVSGQSFQQAIDWGTHLLSYGKPVFINEYGNTTFWSNGTNGALWHAAILPQLFSAGLQPLQYPISHFPGSHEGYNNLGLFMDWRDDWQIKPAYWVYTNFYNYFGNARIHPVNNTSQTPIFAVSKNKNGKPVMAIWINVLDRSEQHLLKFTIENFPAEEVQISFFNNLMRNTPYHALIIEKQPIAFSFQPMPLSSYTIFLHEPDGGCNPCYLPMIRR